jgi:hypothetical protein
LNDPFNNAMFHDNTELQEDNKKLKTATAQLQEELEKIKDKLTQLYLHLNNTEVTPRTMIPSPSLLVPQEPLLPMNDIQDLLNAPSNIVALFNNIDIEQAATIQAKLAKELIKLANSYKIPELTFDVQASKQRFNFSTWYSKLQTILLMFPQTASVIDNMGMVKFYENSNDVGNKALFLLIGSKVDTYFQRAIRHFTGQGDKALAFIKSQCANISNEDRTNFPPCFHDITYQGK